MNDLIYICPPDKHIISKLKDKEIIIRIDDMSKLQVAIDFADSIVPTNPLHSIWVTDTTHCITDFVPKKEWSKYHICWYAKGLGDKLTFLENKSHFEVLNIRFFLPVNNEENIIAIQFLTSLGFHTGIIFEELIENDQMEQLTDLCYYNKYMKVRNGTIEPFDYIQQHYIDKNEFNLVCDFGNLYFSNPSGYIHIDGQGLLHTMNIFGKLTSLQTSIDQLSELMKSPLYNSLLSDSTQHFLQRTKCAYCATWRVCLGKFNNSSFQQYCESFFDNILHA